MPQHDKTFIVCIQPQTTNLQEAGLVKELLRQSPCMLQGPYPTEICEKLHHCELLLFLSLHRLIQCLLTSVVAMVFIRETLHTAWKTLGHGNRDTGQFLNG
ncbi:uncharacterized protein J5F26_004860 isoform 1-T1 [Ciconia maguari]